MIRTKYLAVVGVGLAMACASAPAASTPGVTQNTNVISRDELNTINASNAYDAIQRLRPQYLRSHGSTSTTVLDGGLPAVYVDRNYYGDIYSLREFGLGSVKEIRYYSPSEATSRFSTGSPNGAIQIITGSQ